MTFFYLAVAFFATFVSSAVAAKDVLHLPVYAKTCQRDSPNVNECLLESLKHFQPYLVKGIPSLNLPPLDPLKMDEIFMQYNNGLISAKLGIRDHSVFGLRNLQFQNVRSSFDDLDDFKLDISVFIPEVKTLGRYKLQGKIANTEYGGKGLFNITMSNIKATWAFSGSKQVVDGVTYMRINHLDMEPIVGDMEIYASNLFNGNEALSKTALKFFNENWKLVYRELLPYASKDWDKIMTEIANRVFMRVPFDEIFPVSTKIQPSSV